MAALSERNKTVLIVVAGVVIVGLGVLAMLSGDKVSFSDVLSFCVGVLGGGFFGKLFNKSKEEKNGA